MGKKLASAWEWLAKSRYTRQLEADRARLLADNRAMVDSLLAQLGAPTITEMQSPRNEKLPETRARMLPSQWKHKMQDSTGRKEEN